MNLNDFDRFIQSAPWVFSKEYENTLPHKYTTRKKIFNDLFFEEVIYFIRENSIIKKFYSKEYLYFEHEGFEYWEMGRPIKAVQVLNCAAINDSAKYRLPFLCQSRKNILLENLKQADKNLDALLGKPNKTNKDIELIQYYLNSERKSSNIIDHSSIKPRSII
jgi:hypothetical protein